MNKYLIQKKVQTPIQAEGTLAIQGFRVEPYTGSFQEDLLVTREIEAPSFVEALRVFLTELEPVLNVIAVTTQTMVYPLGLSSTLAYRLNDNPGRLFFVQIANESKTVGMTLFEDTVKDAQKLLGANIPVAMTYMREAINAFSSTHKLAMLISATEALAGSKRLQSKCNKCDAPFECKTCGALREYGSTNREALKEILGEDLYDEIYVKTRIRHKLAHGGDAEIPEAVGIGEKMYSRIVVGYLKEKYGLDALVEIGGAPRGFSLEYSRMGCRMIVEGMPSLPQIEAEWDTYPFKTFEYDTLPTDY